MEVSAKEARMRFSDLLKRAEKGEEVLLVRRGRKVARLVPVKKLQKTLPSLKEFRASIRVKGQPLSVAVVRERQKERF
ncbi:MAG TPA: type II toxin-antitoxin system prevent-host-death family antitoxin [Methylomirabilota bacterium]|nr:type II toxin-antitoxin system prevent-host-death family antitoxin [Methylomirabilota bacterium]